MQWLCWATVLLLVSLAAPERFSWSCSPDVQLCSIWTAGMMSVPLPPQQHLALQNGCVWEQAGSTFLIGTALCLGFCVGLMWEADKARCKNICLLLWLILFETRVYSTKICAGSTWTGRIWARATDRCLARGQTEWQWESILLWVTWSTFWVMYFIFRW